MKYRFVFLALASSVLASCSIDGDPDIFKKDGVVMKPPMMEEVTAVEMADARGVNTAVMGDDLTLLQNEAMLIESQLESLTERLSAIQTEIYRQTPVADMVEPNDMEKIVVRGELIPDNDEIKLPVPERPEAVKAKENPSGDGVVNVRHGIHSNKTRLVLDINGSTKYASNFDKEAGVVTITLPDTKWSKSLSRNYSNLKQLKGYEAKETETGSIVAVGVENTSDIKVMTMTKPNRIVIDLMK